MSARAEGTFTFDSWQEEDVSTDGGTRIYRVVFAKRFEGGISGTSNGWMTMAQHDSGSAAYGGTERYDVTVDGRSGTFVAQHHAGGSEAAGYSFEVLVLDGTADGELAGLTGSVEITQTEGGGHTVALVYDLP